MATDTANVAESTDWVGFVIGCCPIIVPKDDVQNGSASSRILE